MTDTIRSNAFSTMASGDVSDLIKTKMCLYYQAGCSNKKCTFAHSKEELNPPMCRFGITCRKSDCYFYHPGQVLPSKDDLFFRATNGIKFIEPVLTPTSPHLPIKSTVAPVELIINLEEEEEEEPVEVETRVSDGEEKSASTEESSDSTTFTESPDSTTESDMECDYQPQQQFFQPQQQFFQPQPPQQKFFQPQQKFFQPQQQFFQPQPPQQQQPPQPRRRIQFETMMTQDEMMGLMRLLRSKGNNPIILSLG
ncbi:MAG: hypothetical protein PHG66_04675 [Candidatus Colwellbacteria bacterium]|nr:hypothetical protein [Candidatus Colwellbacteria bacterium]